METEGRESEIVHSMCLAGRLWTKGCLGAAKRRHAYGYFMRKQQKRRSFLSSSVLCQMTHQSRLTLWMFARCANEANVFVDAWLKPDFIKLL